MMRVYIDRKLRQIYGIYKFNNLYRVQEQYRNCLIEEQKNSAINFCGLGIFFRFALI
jgi:hypothetical protein